MLYLLLYPLRSEFSFLNVFKYITFRTFGAALTSVLFCMLLGPSFISYMQKKQMKQVVRDDGPKSHLSKRGTPTMGGALILAGVALPTLLWADLENRNVWIALGLTLSYGLVGFVDDYKKVIQKNPKGLAGRYKLLGQIFFAGIAAYFIFKDAAVTNELHFPFFKDFVIDLGVFFIPFSIIVIGAEVQRVALTLVVRCWCPACHLAARPLTQHP